MRIGKLSKENSFWKNLFFKGNVSKMRKVLMDYLGREGVKSELVDGLVCFDFNDYHFTAEIELQGNYAVCEIAHDYEDKRYTEMDKRDRCYLGCMANAKMEEQCEIVVLPECLVLASSFYFTSRKMLCELFSLHFEKLTRSIDVVEEVMDRKSPKCRSRRARHIGFNSEVYTPSETEEVQEVAAVL